MALTRLNSFQSHEIIRDLSEYGEGGKSMNPELDRKLHSLKLSGMATALPARNQEAITSHLAYTEFLELLVEDETRQRRDRLLLAVSRNPHIPEIKTLENFDWSFNPKLPKPLIFDLATGHFVAEHAGVLLLGPPGTGLKAHCGGAIGGGDTGGHNRPLHLGL